MLQTEEKEKCGTAAPIDALEKKRSGDVRFRAEEKKKKTTRRRNSESLLL